MSVEPQQSQGTPSPPFIATAPALEALALLDRSLGAREPFTVVTGEPGVGKSTLVREALRRWGARVHVRWLSPAEATAETLFAVLLGRLGGTSSSNANGPALAQRLVEAIAHAASAGKVVMVVVEDAHTAPRELLLQLVNVAEMARRKPCAFEVLLVGPPELSARLADPALATLADKVGAQVKLSQLTQHDTRHYLLQRSGAGGTASSMFSRKACRDIHGATFGVPRLIETLADEAARRAAKAGSTTISPEHVRSATQALRARRNNPVSGSMPRQRALTAPPEPANAAPAERANATTAKPAGSNGTSAKHEAAAAAKPEPTAATPGPAPAAASGEIKFPDSGDQRVKDWVSRFGGSTGVKIGASHSIPRYEASATLDVPAPSPVRSAPAAPGAPGEAPRTSTRKLIVDEEPPLPPELVARLNKLTTKRRRRGPSTMVQGAALAVSVALLVVVLARQAGFGKHLGIDTADTSARPAATVTPAPPLELGAEPGRPAPHRALTTETPTTRKRPKLILTPTEPSTPAEPTRSEAVASAKPAPKKAVATTHAATESLPPTPYRGATAAAVTAPIAPATGDASPANGHQKFAIVAGTFQSNDMAKAEKDHLARLVQYRVWVNKSKVEGKRSYQLMVGRFDSMERAWDAGQSLMRRGLIRDASVQPLSE